MGRPCIAITAGDPAGVGPEVIESALKHPELDTRFEYEVLGLKNLTPGRPSEEGARQAFEALEVALDGCMQGRYAGVVTGPIHKAKMRGVGFLYPGQTEFFAERSGCLNHAMLLTGGQLSVALVTAHIPLNQVAVKLTGEEIIRVGRLLADFLELRLQRKPRIAVAGLNPHAGESGLLGMEEQSVIEPALRQLRELIDAEVVGPCSPDTVFFRAVQGEFDGVLCMYHDQGLIPLKLHAFDAGVNVTLGLKFPRTSPDHGTAFEIAGQGIARPHSMFAAIQLAAELAAKKML